MANIELNTQESCYDIAIIGGGPGGYVAAIRAAQLGATVVLFEKDTIGGVCLNRGCIPTKTLLKSVKTLGQIRKSEKLGIKGVSIEQLYIDLPTVQKRKQEIINKLTAGVGGLLKANKVTVIKGEARISDVGEVTCNDSKYLTKSIIIATGSSVKKIPIKGIESKNVITSNEALSLTEVPERITILGGGVIGVEFAQIFNSMGSKVTIVEMMDQLLPTIDQDIVSEITKDMKEKGIEVFTGAKAKLIRDNSIVFEQKTKETEIPSDKILLAVGRVPNIEGIPVDMLGIKSEKGAIVTDDKMETNIKGIYAIGDINGKWMLAHKASAEGIVAVSNIMGIEQKMDYRYIPQCLYTIPEVASVGLTEKEARIKYKEINVSKFPYIANGKSLIEDETKGFVKVITDKKHKEILGVHIYGYAATDLIAESVLALNLECTADELAKCIYPHPTISETLSEAFHEADFKAIHY